MGAKNQVKFYWKTWRSEARKKTKIYSGNTWPLNTDLCLKENGIGTPFPSIAVDHDM